ncbi:MAG TPA: penicillin-binding protein 2 [Streptosporangiaceae bacterium]|nr:penicillin-binding protein 2 [Streptosporangiaceae bacterium]
MIPASRRRLAVLYVVVASLLIGLGARLWFVQVMSGTAYASQARQEQTQYVIVPSVRGEILDDTGRPMVDNRSALVVSVNMSVLVQQQDGGVAELHRLASLLGMKYQVLSDEVRPCTATVRQPCWQGSPYQPIPVAQNVGDQVALQVLESQNILPGVTAQVQPVTNYVQPIGTEAAQVLGYLQPITSQETQQRGLPQTGFSGVDLVGQSGLEGQYDQQLQGTIGDKVVSVNAAGQVTGTVRQTAAKPGDNLVTSINAAVQHDAETALANAIHQTQAQGNTQATEGAAVVLTTTGRVVAMASYPTYNPSVWTGGLSEKEFTALFGTANSEPVLNRATQGQYHPGSTWKVTTAAAAVAAGYPLYGSYDCPASVNVGGRVFHNDFGNGGMMSLSQALVVSCDTVFYNFAYGIWQRDNRKANVVTSPNATIQEMQKMELAWGFGQHTGVDLLEGNSGTVPTREWLYYFWKDNAHTGQNWCKYGRANGSYVQQIEYQDCRYGNIWEPGQAVDASIGQGYVAVTPLQLARAYAALANGGTLYSPRIGEALLSPDGKVVHKITPPVVGHLPVAPATLAYIRSALQGVVTSGTAAGAFSGFPLRTVCVAGKTGTAEVAGKLATSVFASYAPCGHPKYVVVMMIPNSGFGADVSAPAVRQIWDGIYGLQGHKAALPGGRLPGLPHINQAGQIVPSSATGGPG